MDSPKYFKFPGYLILVILAFMFASNAFGIELQLTDNKEFKVNTEQDILALSNLLKQQIHQNQTVFINKKEENELIGKIGPAKELTTRFSEFFSLLSEEPKTTRHILINAKNTLLPKFLNVGGQAIQPENATNKSYIQDKINFITLKTEDVDKIGDFLNIACILDFALPVKQSLAKTLAIYLYKLETINNPQATAILKGLSSTAQSYVRYEYLMIFDNFFDETREFYASSNEEILEIVTQLTAAHILPGDVTKLICDTQSIDFTENLAKILATTFYSHLRLIKVIIQRLTSPRTWMMGNEIRKKYLEFKNDWIEILPQNIKDTVKVNYWVVSGKPLDPGGKIFYFRSLKQYDWKTLARAGKIPMFNFQNIQRNPNEAAKLIAGEYVNKKATKNFVSKDHRSTQLFRQMPENFRQAFEIHYRCNCLKQGIDACIDRKKIYLSVNNLREYQLTENLWIYLLENENKTLHFNTLIDKTDKDLTLEIMQQQPYPLQTFKMLKNEFGGEVFNIQSQELSKFNLKRLSEIKDKKLDALSEEQLRIMIQSVLKNLKIGRIRELYKKLVQINPELLEIFYDYIIRKLVEINEIQEKVAWAFAKTLPQKPLRTLSRDEWRYLAKHGRIPNATNFDNSKRLAEEYVSKLSSLFSESYARFWQGFKLMDGDKLAAWLRALPEEFQQNIKTEIRLKGIKNVALDVEIPIARLVEKGHLPKPKGFNPNRPFDMPRLFAEELEKMSPINAKALIQNLKDSQKALTNIYLICSRDKRKESVTKLLIEQIRQFPNFRFPLSELLSSENFNLDMVKTGQTFDLSKIPITSIVKNDFGKHKDITKLIISDTLIKELPQDVFSELANLQEIKISNNPGLERLPADLFLNNKNLIRVDLSNNRLKYDGLPKLDDLKNITLLKFDGNGLTAVNQLPKALQELHLQNNKLTDQISVQISHLNNLLYLDMSNNSIKKLSVVSGLDNMKYLFLASNPGISLDLDPKKPLNNLQTIDLSNCEISEFTENFCRSINFIQRIFARGNKIVENKYNFLGLEFLSELHLGQCGITDIKSDNLKLPNLKILGLEGNEIKIIPRPAFGGIPKLEELYLFCNKIIRIEDSALFNLRYLTHLDLSYNNLESLNNSPKQAPLIFLQTSELKHLTLKHNKLKKICEYTFSALKNLEVLDLEDNCIQKLEWKAFHGVPKTTKIKFRGNNAISATWTRLDREWYNRGPILDAFLLGGSIATFLLLPTFSVPAYLTYGAASGLGLSGLIRGTVRGTIAAKNSIQKGFDWVITKILPSTFSRKKSEPKFIAKNWPYEAPATKNLQSIDEYFESIKKAYRDALLDKSKIVK